MFRRGTSQVVRAGATPGVNPVPRAIRDLGMAAWFGASLMGVFGVNRALADLDDPRERLRVLDAVWDRWTPPGGVAIAAHLLGSATAGRGNASRALAQHGMATGLALKGAISLAALAATVATRALRKQALAAADGAAVAYAPSLHAGATSIAAQAERRLRTAEAVVLVLTGTAVVLNAAISEEQRPLRTVAGILARPLPGR